MRTEAPSEKNLHRAMKRHATARDAASGAVVGALAGALKRRPGVGAAAGAALGAGVGHLRGEERRLKDVTQQERMAQRAEARMTKKSEHEVIMEGFADRLEKQAFLAAVGKSLLGAGLKSGVTRGATGRVMGGLRQAGLKGEAMQKAVGGGVLGLGAAGALGAGYMAGR